MRAAAPSNVRLSSYQQNRLLRSHQGPLPTMTGARRVSPRGDRGHAVSLQVWICFGPATDIQRSVLATSDEDHALAAPFASAETNTIHTLPALHVTGAGGWPSHLFSPHEYGMHLR